MITFIKALFKKEKPATNPDRQFVLDAYNLGEDIQIKTSLGEWMGSRNSLKPPFHSNRVYRVTTDGFWPNSTEKNDHIPII